MGNPTATKRPLSAPLFVRIPQAQADALDRAAFESRRTKQAVVSEVLGRYIASPDDGGTTLGHHSFRAHDAEVLTLEGVAELLRVDAAAVEELARAGELPGRLIGGEWRFARHAVLGWLAAPMAPRSPGRGEQ
jgi:excisionase family DNA binding protein